MARLVQSLGNLGKVGGIGGGKNETRRGRTCSSAVCAFVAVSFKPRLPTQDQPRLQT